MESCSLILESSSLSGSLLLINTSYSLGFINLQVQNIAPTLFSLFVILSVYLSLCKNKFKHYQDDKKNNSIKYNKFEHVIILAFFPPSLSLSTFFNKLGCTNGPFQIPLVMIYSFFFFLIL